MGVFAGGVALRGFGGVVPFIGGCGRVVVARAVPRASEVGLPRQ